MQPGMAQPRTTVKGPYLNVLTSLQVVLKKISKHKLRSQAAAHRVVSALQSGSILVHQCLVQRCPERDDKGNWRCKSCTHLINCNTHLAVHYCSSRPAWSSREMKADQLLCSSNGMPSCILCKQWVSESRPHRCQNIALRLMLADFSASSVAPLTSSGHSHESAMRELRSFGSHAVLVTEARSGELVMRHVVVGPSPISGQGLFTVERLSPKKLVGAYTGLVEPQLQDSGSGSSSSSEGGGGADDESLMSVKVVEGLVLNPTHVGGLMCMANQAHGRTATLEPCVGQVVASNTLVQLMHARRRVAPGEELTWDYRAVTDDPQDPLLQEVCRCRDKQCPGCLLTYVGAVQSAPITAEVFSS